MKEEDDEEMYSGGGDLLPPAPTPEPLGGSITFARGAPGRKSKGILKTTTAAPEEKKKRVRMLFPVDTVTPI